VGGTISSAVQLAAVRRSMDQVRSLLGEVRQEGRERLAGGRRRLRARLGFTHGAVRGTASMRRSRTLSSHGCESVMRCFCCPTSLPLQVQACLSWARQNLAAHQQNQARDCCVLHIVQPAALGATQQGGLALCPAAHGQLLYCGSSCVCHGMQCEGSYLAARSAVGG